ncbi:cytochrome-c oxidase, cbb3-type subunit III [Phaeovulum vinaykumarii]|uniref:Cbb3-type cytochrome c oxidase subunit n=1 Tax=Phaeovulum vinaykumarii TaxID=407234 RepID=A0A1N7KSR3_9RHOB|nr:cytochrome-c oxidase, cbb3-type subunit III [Phaeovulum vinaykumarii]SIS64604.1 cytochrome c oxidase cbb3-type subunit 3 [Phaeovulum vinaykumarii]SOC01540.1 cytochrome c oxidase cbb3-type subunit 3 [Phaeovulum vinaykumarii]
MTEKPVKPTKVEVETTGHEWDGIEELNTPLPRWWLWIFYACVVWALLYSVAYPAWPLVNGATPGLLGASTRKAVEEDIARFDARLAPIEAKLVETDLTEISADPDLANYTQNAGAAVFRTWCAQCHGAGAGGNVGYPNLLDDDWIHGGSIEDIYTTVMHGIRATDDPDTRYVAPMAAWSELLEPEEISNVVEYVLLISGQDHDAAMAGEGALVFEDNCAACHGEDGKGMREMGSPNLTDGIWLYGGDRATITETVAYGRAGVMPAWGYAEEGAIPRLSEADVRAVAAYVHSLGGGE